MRKRGGRNNVVGIVIKSRAGCPRNLGSIPGRDKRFFSLLQSVQAGSGPHQVFLFSVGTGSCSPGLKRPWREADHAPPSSVGVNDCSYIRTPSCLHGCIVTAKGKVVR